MTKVQNENLQNQLRQTYPDNQPHRILFEFELCFVGFEMFADRFSNGKMPGDMVGRVLNGNFERQ